MYADFRLVFIVGKTFLSHFLVMLLLANRLI